MTDSAKKYLLWLDVEATGLDAASEHLLQVAAVLTDPTATIEYGTFERIIWYPRERVETMRAATAEVVRSMHDMTGLWSKLPSGTPHRVADEELVTWLRDIAPERRSTRLAGNSVRLDLNFLEHHLPGTYGHLHYRSVDVSALAYAPCGSTASSTGTTRRCPGTRRCPIFVSRSRNTDG